MNQQLAESIREQPAWYVQAQNLAAVRRYALAEELVRRELAQNPRLVLALVVLSWLLEKQKRLAEAEAAARQALALQPAYAEAYYFLAFSLYGQTRLAEAGSAINTALALAPATAKYYALRSQLELQWNYPVQSRTTAEEGLQRNPTNLECLHMRLQALRRLGEQQLAEDTALTLLRLSPNYWQAHLALGYLLLQRKAYASAETHFRSVLRQQPDMLVARQGLSLSWKQRYWLPRQLEKLDDHIADSSDRLEARLGKAGNILLLLGIVLAMPVLCLPLILLYGWAYLRWRLAPVVLQLRGRPLAWLGPLTWRLVVAGLGCVGAAVLAGLIPARLPVVAATLAGLATLGVWREVWGEPGPEPERKHVEWFWMIGAAAIVFLFWLDDTPPAFRARLMLFGYTAALSLMIFVRPPVRQ